MTVTLEEQAGVLRLGEVGRAVGEARYIAARDDPHVPRTLAHDDCPKRLGHAREGEDVAWGQFCCHLQCSPSLVGMIVRTIRWYVYTRLEENVQRHAYKRSEFALVPRFAGFLDYWALIVPDFGHFASGRTACTKVSV